jgi:hypothetical protein
MITQQSVNDLSVQNERRLNVSLTAEIEELRKRAEAATTSELALREETQLLKGKLEQVTFDKNQVQIAF